MLALGIGDGPKPPRSQFGRRACREAEAPGRTSWPFGGGRAPGNPPAGAIGRGRARFREIGRRFARADRGPTSYPFGAAAARRPRRTVKSFVIDASIAVKWVVEEEGTPEALALRAHAKLIAPDLLVA